MTELSGKVKTALDETRTLILGSQILIGFQFQAAFQNAFEQLPAHARWMDGAALILMVSVAALLIAPSVYHRIVENGQDSVRIHHMISIMAEIALLPFAVSLGLDLFIAMERVADVRTAFLVGLGFGGLALLCWYGIEFLARRTVGGKERAMALQRRKGSEPTPLHARIEQMLTEARVILPGAQALLGFQLAITITQSFDQLSDMSKLVHAGSLGLVALTIILLMAPAAYHRIVYAGEDTEEFHRTGSTLVTAATLPLALGLGCDIHVVIGRIFASPSIGAAVAIAATIGFIGLWHLYPLAVRLRTGGGSSRRAGARR
jgi:hypothetical protein